MRSPEEQAAIRDALRAVREEVDRRVGPIAPATPAEPVPPPTAPTPASSGDGGRPVPGSP